MIKWRVSKAEHALLEQVARRAMGLAHKHAFEYQFQDALMDVTAAHANGCSLQLPELLAADDFDFAHDVFGIRRHLNRQTGELMDSFLPRYAKPERAA
jgi:hypothetical protein